jgi:hypothetical protein
VSVKISARTIITFEDAQTWLSSLPEVNDQTLQVLRLMEDFHQHQVEEAVAQALHLGTLLRGDRRHDIDPSRCFNSGRQCR